MIRCKKCGAAIKDGQVFCPKCGTEIQLVPDFYSQESVSYAKKKREEDAKEEAKRRRIEEEAFERKKAIQRRKRIISLSLFFSLIILIFAAAIFAFLFVKNNNSYDYQFQKAEKHLSDKQYEKALSNINRAIQLDSGNTKALLLKTDILIGLRQTDDAGDLLKSIIKQDAENETAYEALIGLLYANGDFDEIKGLLDAAKSDKILTKFADYIASDPVFSIPSGSYSAGTEISLSGSSKTNEETIYYTTDGSDPDMLSKKYIRPFAPDAGTYVIKAVSYNEKGIMSNIITETIVITE